VALLDHSQAWLGTRDEPRNGALWTAIWEAVEVAGEPYRPPAALPLAGRASGPAVILGSSRPRPRRPANEPAPRPRQVLARPLTWLRPGRRCRRDGERL